MISLPSRPLVLLLLTLLSVWSPASAFSPVQRPPRTSAIDGATVLDPPVETPEKQSYSNEDFAEMNETDEYDDLEYLLDPKASREMEDPFHILLLGETFQQPKATISYVAGSLQFVLDMPSDEARDQSTFARDQGMACLGTWTREECLELGRQLQRREIVCRVVPFCKGGQRGWQAKNTSDSNSEVVQ